MDGEDLEDNLQKIATKGNLSPKKIDKLKISQGLQKKKDKGSRASSMQTKSSAKNKSRRVQDLSMALFCKLWWKFRTKSSIWSAYMKNKYCKSHQPNKVMWKPGGGSHVWKKMLQDRDIIEHQILWQLKGWRSKSVVW